MKRTAELRNLPEDHHQGLVQARRLRQAASGEGDDPTKASGPFLGFWQKETRIVLLPRLYGRLPLA